MAAMDVVLTDLQQATAVVGTAVNLFGAAIALYLWTEQKYERYLLYWALAWTTGTLRWLVHYPAQSHQSLLAVEGVLIAVILAFMVLGSWALLPARRWPGRRVAWVLGLLLVTYVVVGPALNLTIEIGYGLYIGALAACGLTLLNSFRQSGLTGYVIAACTFLFQCAFVCLGLLLLGKGVADHIAGPLYNVALALSIVVIAYQRSRSELERSLGGLQEAAARLRASAVEMRQLYVRLGSVEDDERRALHAKLHDLIGPNLSALRMSIDLVRANLARHDSRSAQGHLESAGQVTAETIAAVRNLVRELRPPALDDYGLVAALRAFADTHSQRCNLPIDVFGSDLSPRLEGAAENALFRIAQEALVNAAKHASATRVVVSVKEHAGRIVLTVDDDGVGFDPEAVRRAEALSWGMKHMHERAQAIAAELRIDSTLGAGTRIVVDMARPA